MTIARFSAAAALAGVASALCPLIALGAGSGDRDCFAQLERSRSREIVCRLDTRLTDKERADLQRVTRGVLQDARCIVSIRVERAAVEAALRERDLIFEAPPQPVTCEVATKDKPYEITATFAPWVEFKDGKAISATAGLADVQGVPRVLAWPAVQYVNRSSLIRDGILKIVNAYKAHYAIAEAR